MGRASLRTCMVAEPGTAGYRVAGSCRCFRGTEFAQRGDGTPIPYDPPKQFVVSGLYRYISNPMQLSCALLMTAWGCVLRTPWVAAAGIMSFLYSLGLAAWDEGEDMRVRFGKPWEEYRKRQSLETATDALARPRSSASATVCCRRVFLLRSTSLVRVSRCRLAACSRSRRSSHTGSAADHL